MAVAAFTQSPLNVAALELERLSLAALMPAPASARAASLRDVNAQLATLSAQVHNLPRASAAEHLVAERVLVALDARRQVLDSQLRELTKVYTDEHPAVRWTREEARLVDERRAALQPRD